MSVDRDPNRIPSKQSWFDKWGMWSGMWVIIALLWIGQWYFFYFEWQQIILGAATAMGITTWSLHLADDKGPDSRRRWAEKNVPDKPVGKLPKDPEAS